MVVMVLLMIVMIVMIVMIFFMIIAHKGMRKLLKPRNCILIDRKAIDFYVFILSGKII